ncbi:MAG: hypothetical protein OXG39_18270 [Chloroflexi bacterium]|nr:hypothetical protein [Chloroflexota bacterium]
MKAVWIVDYKLDTYNSLSFRFDDYTLPKRDGTRQLASWQPQQVWYHPAHFREDRGIADFPRCSGEFVCNTEVRDLVDELLADYVEFLPLTFPDSADTEYYAINVLSILDCLDNEQSEFSYYGPLKKINKYAFKTDCVSGVPMFRLPIQRSVNLFVDDEFKQLVEDNNLTGLEFRKVWEG